MKRLLCCLTLVACGADAALAPASNDDPRPPNGDTAGSTSSSSGSADATASSSSGELGASSSGGETTGDAGPTADADAGPLDAGEPEPLVHVLTYNVGGLADFISSGTPSQTTPQISPKLNPFDLVLVQEDFAHHDKLISQITHAYRHDPGRASFPKLYGDGLAVFSRRPIGETDREQWDDCNGTTGSKNDCLAEKGFVRLVVTLAPGVEIDVYDLHMDAGRGDDDAAARDEQTSQLAAYLNEHSAGRPVLVAGDTNMKEEDEASFARLLQLTQLRDVCRELSCPQPYLHDRVLLRDSSALRLHASNWHIDETFVNVEGQPLSDHGAIAVDLTWSP